MVDRNRAYYLHTVYCFYSADRIHCTSDIICNRKDGQIMEYISAPEAAKKWGISERRVQKLCEENRIPGVVRFSRMWLIPKDAEKPKDGRLKNKVSSKSITIESVINQYGQYVYNLALKLSANPENAEDLTQETLIKAWKHLQDIKDTSAIKNWLRTICINEFRMMFRKEKRENICFVENIEDLESDSMLLVDVQPLALDEIQTTEEVGKLRDGCFLAMTQKLSLNQRLAFSLIDMFGMSLKDVAEILELTPKAVKGLLYRARMNLDSFFQGHCSFLDINNPCKCTAWIDFLQTRNSLQEIMEQTLDYKKTGYVFDPEVRQKILHYYHDMPSQKPSREWFDKVILLVRNFYK